MDCGSAVPEARPSMWTTSSALSGDRVLICPPLETTSFGLTASRGLETMVQKLLVVGSVTSSQSRCSLSIAEWTWQLHWNNFLCTSSRNIMFLITTAMTATQLYLPRTENTKPRCIRRVVTQVRHRNLPQLLRHHHWQREHRLPLLQLHCHRTDTSRRHRGYWTPLVDGKHRRRENEGG
jgi:hypothetical protein